MTELRCKWCGEWKDVEVTRYVDRSGRRKVAITCDILVHAEPVQTVMDDPTTPDSSIGAGGDSLVHDLELYRKLVEIVYSFDGPVEHAVIEHELAERHPDDYEVLVRKQGHAMLDDSGYTMSTYLASLLGTLGREQSLGRVRTDATAPWDSGKATAWSHPERRDGPVTTWADHAEAQGIDPTSWPATEELATAA